MTGLVPSRDMPLSGYRVLNAERTAPMELRRGQVTVLSPREPSLVAAEHSAAWAAKYSGREAGGGKPGTLPRIEVRPPPPAVCVTEPTAWVDRTSSQVLMLAAPLPDHLRWERQKLQRCIYDVAVSGLDFVHRS